MAAIRGFSLSNISKVSIVFSSFDSSTTSTRQCKNSLKAKQQCIDCESRGGWEFLRRVTSTSMKDSNPKCTVSVDICGDYCNPKIDLTLKNGDSLSINPTGRSVLEIIAEVNSRTKL